MLQHNSAAGKPSATNDSATSPSLTNAQERSIAALLESPTIEAAACKAGVTEASLRRWMRDDEGFRSKMREMRREAHSKLERRLQETALKAIDDLIGRAQAKKLIEPGRASLMRTTIEFAFRPPRYFADIEDRITTIEKQLAARETPAAASDCNPAA